MVALPGRSSLHISKIAWCASKGGLSKSSWGSPCSNNVTTTQFYSRFMISSHHWRSRRQYEAALLSFQLAHGTAPPPPPPPNTFWSPLSPKRAELAHTDSEVVFSSLYLTLLSFSHPHFILPHTLSTLFQCTYARSTHSQNLKEKHSSTYFHTHAHAPDI